jgi:sortase (surface protein transpeptidase)
MTNTPWLKLACAGAVAAAAMTLSIQALAAPSGWLNVDGNIRFAGGGGSVDWANAGPAGAACSNGGINVTGSGGLFNCGTFNGVSTPPTPPLRIAANPSIISSAFISDPMSSDTTTCPSGSGKGDPTTVQGGTNDDALNSYTISTGSVPIKDELTNVYAVSHTRASDGFPELYFAAERPVNNGNSHIDFEFLQSVVTRTASCGGTFAGHRSQGDLLVAADFSNGGQAATPSVWQWHCAPIQPDGTICDPGSGAAYAQLAVPPGIVAFDLNTAADIACGGWACRDATGALTAVVQQFDFVEGGINLHDLGFTGCFNTFLPHTRTSDPFNAQLADFTGPQPLASCRTPVTNSAPTGSVSPGTSVHDTIILTNGGASPPQGTVTFFLCQPAQVSGSGCATGTQVGLPKALVAGLATSDSTGATTSTGKYCWRTVFVPAPGFEGIYFPGSHTNASTECFNVVVAASLPDTGLPEIATQAWSPLLPAVLVIPLLPMFAWRRSRSVAALLIAGVVLGGSPVSTRAPTPGDAPTKPVSLASTAAAASPTPLHLATIAVREAGWRLVIPRIGVDAPIVPVGRDRNGAMASPTSLDGVGWFNSGPAPGQPGDAVIDGHYGVEQPAVFRKLHFLRPGDEVDVVWPDGHTTYFQVSGLETVPAGSHPAGVFSRAGPARLSLITCAGEWVQSKASYSDRLIVTAMLS